jgi:hypothetical protein
MYMLARPPCIYIYVYILYIYTFAVYLQSYVLRDRSAQLLKQVEFVDATGAAKKNMSDRHATTWALQHSGLRSRSRVAR